MLKLPRKVEEDSRFPAITDLLAQTRKPLWEKSAIPVSELPWTPAVERVLSIAVRARKVEIGLETVERVLGIQKRGLDAVHAKQASVPANRVSRVLLVSNDGSERFYRACESLLGKHGERLLLLRFGIPAGRMGEKIIGPGKEIKVVLLADREHVENLLFSLVDPGR